MTTTNLLGIKTEKAFKELLEAKFEDIKEVIIDEAVKKYRERITDALAKVSVDICKLVSIQQFGSEIRITLDTNNLKLKDER